MSLFFAPIAFMIPISFVLSITAVYMVLAILTPPTNSEIAAIPISTICTINSIVLNVFMKSSVVCTVKSSFPSFTFLVFRRRFFICSATVAGFSPSFTVIIT